MIKWTLISSISAVLLTVFGAAILGSPPENHYLLKAPDPKENPVVVFEAGYFTYLATITAAVIAALLAFLGFSKDGNLWRTPAIVSVIFFTIGLAIVTTGYAIRNLWLVTGTGAQKGLPPWLVSIDLYAAGPITAIAYAVGCISLVYAAWKSV